MDFQTVCLIDQPIRLERKDFFSQDGVIVVAESNPDATLQTYNRLTPYESQHVLFLKGRRWEDVMIMVNTRKTQTNGTFFVGFLQNDETTWVWRKYKTPPGSDVLIYSCARAFSLRGFDEPEGVFSVYDALCVVWEEYLDVIGEPCNDSKHTTRFSSAEIEVVSHSSVHASESSGIGSGLSWLNRALSSLLKKKES